ncbi:MAG: O-antigen ligase family protein [Candidatus Omnitrophica bacterium]|nr:O-antigen ligase family protein [Candidatus Omnitrophota bacterium]
MPAFFVAITSFTKYNRNLLSKFKSLFIIISFILTYSTIGYIGIVCAVMLLLMHNIKSRYATLYIAIVGLLCLFLYKNVADFNVRVNQTYEFITGKLDWKKTNQSTYTFIRNALVTNDALRNNPVFGNGLGSHQISFNKFTKEKELSPPYGLFICNARDASSLFLRLLSETGIFGLAVFLIFIAGFFINKRRNTANYLWIINNSILILFIIRLIRQGHYFSEGFFFFIWIYYFSNPKPRNIYLFIENQLNKFAKEFLKDD